MLFQRPCISKSSGGARPRTPQQLAPSAIVIGPLINLTLLRHCVCSQRQRLARKLRDIYNDCTLSKEVSSNQQIVPSLPPNQISVMFYDSPLYFFAHCSILSRFIFSVLFFLLSQMLVLGLTFSQLFINPALVPFLCVGLYGRAVS